MASSRAKGISYVREIRKILCEDWEHLVDGPFYRPTFFKGGTHAVHTDLFNVFDLVSFDPNVGQYCMHQVTVLDKKKAKIDAIKRAGLVGYVWCRCKAGRKVYWRLFYVSASYDGEIPVEMP